MSLQGKTYGAAADVPESSRLKAFESAMNALANLHSHYWVDKYTKTKNPIKRSSEFWTEQVSQLLDVIYISISNWISPLLVIITFLVGRYLGCQLETSLWTGREV